MLIRTKISNLKRDDHPEKATAPTAASARRGSKAPSTGIVSARPSGVHGSRLKTALSWCTCRTVLLENTGSVARDHLANERTFLAWLRTSITLASVGIVIAQLFRLSSSRYTLPTDSGNPTSDTSSPSPPIPAADVPQVLANLLAASDRQDRVLAILQAAQADERRRYDRLGKPVGATFLMISVIFIMLAIHRYLSVHHFLVNRNHFPPARRSIILVALMMMALACTTFSLLFILR